MPRQTNTSLLGALSRLPWYFSIATAATVYGITAFLLPRVVEDNQLFYRLADTFIWVAPYIAGIFLLPVPVSLFNSWQKRKILDKQKDIQSIKSLSWRDFERLTGEAYRRQGYQVTENDSAGADGGIDLIIRKNGAKYLVQCKQWRSQKIGVSIVREMFGLIAAEKAHKGIVITAGTFTQPAHEFAKGKPLELIGGEQLLDMIRIVQKEANYSPVELDPGSGELPCPDCGSKMFLRTAKRGSMKGNQFWGCSKFPACRGSRDCGESNQNIF